MTDANYQAIEDDSTGKLILVKRRHTKTAMAVLVGLVYLVYRGHRT